VTARIDANAATDPARAAADVFKDYGQWRDDELVKMARQPAQPPRKRAPRLVLINDETGEPMGRAQPTPPAKRGCGLVLLNDDALPPAAA